MASSSRPADSLFGASSRTTHRTGRLLVTGMLALAIGLAAFAVWFQWRQTRRCLAFFGAETAARIQSAPRVELWDLDGRTIEPRQRLDVSAARGLVHLRRGLVEDGNFAWEPVADGSSNAVPEASPSAWDAALAFFESPMKSQPGSVLLFQWGSARSEGRPTHRPGRMAVVGQPGVAGLGRIEKGLRAWIEATWNAARENRPFEPR